MSIRPQESVRQRDGHQGRRELRGSWGEQGTSLKQGRSCVSHFPVAVGTFLFVGLEAKCWSWRCQGRVDCVPSTDVGVTGRWGTGWCQSHTSATGIVLKKVQGHRWSSWLPCLLSFLWQITFWRKTGIVSALKPKDVCCEERAVESLYIHLDSREKRCTECNHDGLSLATGLCCWIMNHCEATFRRGHQAHFEVSVFMWAMGFSSGRVLSPRRKRARQMEPNNKSPPCF